MAPTLTVRIWPEDDGWHVDVQGGDGLQPEPPFESFSSAKSAFRSVADAMRQAQYVKLIARPDDADD